MDILSISKDKNESLIRLDSTELVALCNVLYQATKNNNANATVYQLYGNLMIARDLSQYGHIDGFCFDNIAKCREKAKVRNMTVQEYNEEFQPRVERAECFVNQFESAIRHMNEEKVDKAEVKRQFEIRNWSEETKQTILAALRCYEQHEGIDKLKW